MTHWQVLTAFLCLYSASFGQNRGCLGIEITEIIRSGNAGIQISHAISEKWSSDAVASFHIYTPTNKSTESKTYVELSFRHWVRECYEGAYLSFGVFSGFKQKTDIKLKFGYSFPAWKCIGMDIGYGFSLIDSIRQKTSASGKLSITINYRF